MTEEETISTTEENSCEAENGEDIESLKTEWAEKYARLLAEFDNFRKRSREKRTQQAEEKKQEFILELLDVVDNFERALEACATQGQDNVHVEGFNAIDRQLIKLLANHGVQPQQVLGEVFDPNLHDAIGAVEAEDVEPGIITQQARVGWLINKQVLRPAQVLVAKAANSSITE